MEMMKINLIEDMTSADLILHIIDYDERDEICPKISEDNVQQYLKRCFLNDDEFKQEYITHCKRSLVLMKKFDYGRL